MERSKLVCTPDDITNLKEKLQKIDIVDLCTRERANTKWKFYKLTNLTIFAALLKDVPMICKYSVLPGPLLINQNANCPTSEQITKKPCRDNFASSEHLLFTCMEIRDSKKKHPKISKFSWTIVGKEIHQSLRVFTWLIFQKWRRYCNSILFFTTLTLWMKSWLEN